MNFVSAHNLFPETKLFNNSSFDAKKEKKILGIILLSALLIRVITCFFVTRLHIQRDTLDYFQQADIILNGAYKNYFPNGYPFIIAFAKLLTGPHFIQALLWFNILASTISVYFIYDIAKKVTGNAAVAILSAILLSVFPTQINYVRWILSEVPSVFFLAGFFFFYLRKRNWLSGLFAGLAIVIRTEIMMIVLLVLILELISFKKIRIWLLAGFAIPIMLIGGYCYQKTGTFSLSGHGKVNILYAVTASGGYVDWMYESKHPEIKTSGEAMQFYMQEMKKKPIQFIKNRIANVWELWGFYPSSSGGNRSTSARLLIGATNLFLLLFGLWGWWLCRKNFYSFILILPFVVVTGVHTLLLALPRYTYIAELFMIIFCALTLTKLMSGIKKVHAF